MLRNFIRRNIRRTSSDTKKSNPLKSLLVSSAVIGGAGAIILDIPKVYENVLSLIIGNNPERFKSYHDIRLYLLENVFSDNIGLEWAGKYPPIIYDSLSTYCKLIRGPIGTQDSFLDYAEKDRLNSAFALLSDKEETIRFHNGKFLEDMKVTVFEGSTEDIISKVKESDSNLFKVAVVEDIDSNAFNKLLDNRIDLICLKDEIILKKGLNCINKCHAELDQLRG